VTKPLPAAEREKWAAQRDEARHARRGTLPGGACTALAVVSRPLVTAVRHEPRRAPVEIEEVVAAWFFGRPVSAVRADERRLVVETLGCLS
jgi:hypothetical protein